MTYLPHQATKAGHCLDVLMQYGICLLFGEPRSGKTRTAILAAELSPATRVLVVTKKAAISGWHSEIKAVDPEAEFTVTNYEQCRKIRPGYGLVIVDESHNLNKTGRPTQRFAAVRHAVGNSPVLMLSGTPSVEKLPGVYYQFGCSARFSPFRQFNNFYAFFQAYGIPDPIWVNGRKIEQYRAAKPTLMPYLEPLIVRMSQEEAGITQQVKDHVHLVELEPWTKGYISGLLEDSVIMTEDGELHTLDSDIAVRNAVHQIESGAVLVNNEIWELPNNEVIDYIKRTFGTKGLVVMAHYRSTRQKLERHFPVVLSSDAHAEGVDLSMYDNFVIVNSAYSGAKFIQRRERVVNINRTTPATVHHILTDAGISRDVYEAISSKRDFNIRMFRRVRADHTAAHS